MRKQLLFEVEHHFLSYIVGGLSQLPIPKILKVKVVNLRIVFGIVNFHNSFES